MSSANRCPYLTLKVLLFAFCVFARSDFQIAAQTEETNKQPEIQIRLTPNKEAVMLNEPTFLSFEIRNNSSQDVCVWEGSDYRNRLGRPNSFKVRVSSDGGTPVPQPEAFGEDGLVGDCAKIPANGSHVLKLFLPHWATFETTGSYIVNVKKTLSIQRNSTWVEHRSMESSSHVKADVSASLTIVPTDAIKMGEIIDSFGNAMNDINNPENRNSARALAHVDDKRAIKYFVQALQQFGAFQELTLENWISLAAATALSKFDDDSAVAALDAAIHSPSEETRESVAWALAYSKHPKALELLMKMQNDSEAFVRLEVAKGLSKARSKESFVLLRQMLKDEDQAVRTAAQDSLNTRGAQSNNP